MAAGLRVTLLVMAVQVAACGPTERDGSGPLVDRAAAQLSDCPADAVSCSLQLQHLSRLGAFDGPGALEASPTDVLMDGLGRIWVTVAAATRPYVFDTLGSLTMRPGREGEGPGEFRWPFAVEAMDADSVAVFDGTVARVSVLDREGRYGRGWIMGSPSDRPIRVVGDTFASGVGACRRGTAGAVQVSWRSTVQRALDSSGPRQQPFDCLRVIAVSSDGGLWIADRHEYSVRRFGLDGTQLDSLQARPDWWRTRSSYDWQIRRSPGPFISAIHEDKRGRLWIAMWRDSEKWVEAWGRFNEDRVVRGEMTARDTPPQLRLFSTMIEVWDVASHRLLHSERWPGLVISFLRDDLWVGVSEDAYGVQYLDLWYVRLVHDTQG